MHVTEPLIEDADQINIERLHLDTEWIYFDTECIIYKTDLF